MLMGLRGRSIALSVAVFFIVGTISLFLIHQFTRSIAISMGEKYALEHATHHSSRILDMLSFNIRLAQKITTAELLLEWLSDEDNSEKRRKLLKLMNDSTAISKADSWFVALKESEHFYYDDLSRSFKGKEKLKKLSIASSSDAWFYHTLRSASDFNLNIDYDASIEKTKLWLNVPVRHASELLGVIGFGVDYTSFVDAYIRSANKGFQAIILNPQGVILGHMDEAIVTHNVHTTEPNSWKTIWSHLDAKSQESLKTQIQALILNPSNVSSTELIYDTKPYTVALAYIPHLDWIGLSMVDTEAIFNLYDMRVGLFIFVLLACVVALVIYSMTHYYLLYPIQNLTDVTKAVSLGDYTKRIPLHAGTDNELSLLCLHVNQMIDAVEDTQTTTQERYRWLAENSHDVIWVMDLHYKLIYISPSVELLRGYSVEEEMAVSIEESVCPSSLELFHEITSKAIDEVKKGTIPTIPIFQIEQPRKDGTTFWAEVKMRILPYFKDGTLCFIGVSRDITHRLEAEQEIQQLAFYDPLTHLANRRLLLDRLQSYLFTCKRKQCYGGLIFFDLDNFKPLNDQFGHHLGDELLVEVANRLRSNIRAIDTASRFGGDEFIVLLVDLGNEKEQAKEMASQIATKIGALLANPYDLSGITYTLTASIGVVLFGENAMDAKSILDEADRVMYQAKEAGKECVIVKGTFL